jgi:hypothetical protein
MGILDGYKTYDTSDGFGSRKQWQKAFNQRISPEEAAEILKNQTDTPEQLLGIKKNQYSAQDISIAYRMKMKEWHPDVNPHREVEATEMCKKINAAYILLKSKIK